MSDEIKEIRIDFCGFWNSFKKDDNLFYRLLSKHFSVEISDRPDFLICSNRGRPFEYMKYDCVRLMFMGENLSPDFTVFDYVIGFDDLTFGDRYFRLPFAYYFDSGIPWEPERLTRDRAQEILSAKDRFCNFIYGHRSSNGLREALFEELSAYKPVVSPGSFLNNVGTAGCGWAEKYRYLTDCKFTIAGDSVSYPGFVTEKIMQPLQYHSVPIYCGAPDIERDFDTGAIVVCRSGSDEDIKEAVERVRYLDTHDDAYIETLMRYPFRREEFLIKRYAELETFLVSVFSQPPHLAGRRIRHFCADLHESYLKDYMRRNKNEALPDRVKRAIKNKLR